MGLEVASYISGLNVSWPLAGDTKSQGDDHLRLIKTVLTTTFPNASRPFYIPSAEAFSSTITLDVTDQNNLIMVDVTAGDVACTLPSTLGANDKGWECEIMRSNPSAGTNGVVVSPASGTIASVVGATATIRIERLNEPVRFKWTGSGWIAIKPGPQVGSCLNWDGTTLPLGYRTADGTVYSATTFAELNAALGTTTLRDKRGRVEAGVDSATLLLNGIVVSTVGGTGGSGTITLTAAQIPAHDHGVYIRDPGHTHTISLIPTTTYNSPGGATNISGVPAGGSTGNSTTGITIGSVAGVANDNKTATNIDSGGAHNNVQPTIITNKLVRVA